MGDLQELEAFLIVPVEVVSRHCQPGLGVLLQQRHCRHRLPLAGAHAVLLSPAAFKHVATPSHDPATLHPVWRAHLGDSSYDCGPAATEEGNQACAAAGHKDHRQGVEGDAYLVL